MRQSLIFFQLASPLRWRRLSAVCRWPLSVDCVPVKCNASSPSLISNGKERILAVSLSKFTLPFKVGAFRLPPNVRFALSSPSTFSSLANNWLVRLKLKLWIWKVPPSLRAFAISCKVKSVLILPWLWMFTSDLSAKLLLAKFPLRLICGKSNLSVRFSNFCVRERWLPFTCSSANIGLSLNQAMRPLPERWPVSISCDKILFTNARSKRLISNGTSPFAPTLNVCGKQRSVLLCIQQWAEIVVSVVLLSKVIATFWLVWTLPNSDLIMAWLNVPCQRCKVRSKLPVKFRFAATGLPSEVRCSTCFCSSPEAASFSWLILMSL